MLGAAAQGETYPAVEPWPAKQLLAFEKEALGFYISGHPLDRYRDDLARYATATTSDFIEGRRSAGEAAVGGVVAQYREMITKKGDKMARFVLEDQAGTLEVVCFPKTFERCATCWCATSRIPCSGKAVNEGTAEGAEWKILLEDAQQISELRKAKTTRVFIDFLERRQRHQGADRRGCGRSRRRAPRGGCQAIVRLVIPQRSQSIIPLAIAGW